MYLDTQTLVGGVRYSHMTGNIDRFSQAGDLASCSVCCRCVAEVSRSVVETISSVSSAALRTSARVHAEQCDVELQNSMSGGCCCSARVSDGLERRQIATISRPDRARVEDALSTIPTRWWCTSRDQRCSG